MSIKSYELLTFTITRKITESEPAGDALKILLDFGISSFMAKPIADQSPDHEFIQYACDESKKRGTTNPQGFLLTAIEDLKADFDVHKKSNAKMASLKIDKEAKAVEKERSFMTVKNGPAFTEKMKTAVEQLREVIGDVEREEMIDAFISDNKWVMSRELAETTVAEKWLKSNL